MLHKIPFDYQLFSDNNYVGSYVAYVNLSDKQIKESSDFIADGHLTGELEDLPGKVFDKIKDAIIDDAYKMARKMKIDGGFSVRPSHLSPEFIKLLPEEVYRKIDMECIFEERDVSSIEELLEKAEPEQVKEKSDAPFMKTLAIRQPWASLIACGVKDIECRESMPTKCRKIFVAASGSKVPWNALDGMVKNVLTNLEKAGKLPSYDKLPQKCIIGYVDIVNVTFDHVESVWGRDWNGIKYVLENAHELDEYIYGKNKATPYFYNTEGYDENNLPAAHKVDLTGIDLPK